MNKEIKIKITSVNISEKKGVIKKPVPFIELYENGIKNDAHSGKWHRQVSLLAEESVHKFEKLANRKINFGEFAENITTKGLELYKTCPLDRFVSEEIELEVTQIGKKCHGDSCAIYREVGNCVMPKEGIFARVIKGGKMKPGDELTYMPKVFNFKVITLSDRASQGAYEDKSGPRIIQLVEEHYKNSLRETNISYDLIPDDPLELKSLLQDSIDNNFDVIITTGGTGVGVQDITPGVVKPFIEKEIPGIMENIRVKYGSQKPNALLSRGVAGVNRKTQLYTLPGSVKAVNEYMHEIFKTLDHLILMQHGIDAH